MSRMNEGGKALFLISKRKAIRSIHPSTPSLVAVVVLVVFVLLLDLGSQVEAVEVLVLVDRRHVVARLCSVPEKRWNIEMRSSAHLSLHPLLTVVRALPDSVPRMLSK